MSSAKSLRYEARLVADCCSPHGPITTDIRAIIVLGIVNILRDDNRFQDYAAELPAVHLETIEHAIASSWIPWETYIAHLEAIAKTSMSDLQIGANAERMGSGLFDNLYGTVIRMIQKAGGKESLWIGLRQTSRVFFRMYRGGRCQVHQVGPKDATLTFSGMRHIQSRVAVLSLSAFLRGAFRHTTRSCVVKALPTQGMPPDQLTLSISWV